VNISNNSWLAKRRAINRAWDEVIPHLVDPYLDWRYGQGSTCSEAGPALGVQWTIPTLRLRGDAHQFSLCDVIT
jgi:hypothetical protein